MKRRFISLALVLVVGGVFLSSCQKEEPLSSNKDVTSFIFEASKNVALEQNIVGVISGTSITASVPFGADIISLIPTIMVSTGAELTPGSGQTTDFSSPVTYTVTAEDGSIKEFDALVALAPAPYVGTWRSNAINFGLGLMYVQVEIDDEGALTLVLEDLISGDLNSNSLKGSFNPKSGSNEDIAVSQAFQWIDKKWTATNAERTFMYHFDNAPAMHFYYCYCYPKDSWAFEVDLHKQ
ncbi:MAG: hypothetical protein HOG34_00445 [Bacteroidetes bacterium]|nr:hypothetical protein [Bacteroidota bacterium]